MILVLQELFGQVKNTLGSILGFAVLLLIITLPLFIAYFVIKKAVKNAIIEAHEEINDTEEE